MKPPKEYEVKAKGQVVGYVSKSDMLPDYWHWRVVGTRDSGACSGKPTAAAQVRKYAARAARGPTASPTPPPQGTR